MNGRDLHLVRRITALPEDSEARYAVLKLMRCYSVSVAVSLLAGTRGSHRDHLVRELEDILEMHGFGGGATANE